MADRISWIKNLLSLATPTEREALSQVRTHAADPGTERLIIGDRHGPADLSQTLQNIGDNKQVMWPDGFRELKQKIAGEGSEMFQAHAHPSGDPTPSLADLETWANDHYVSALNKQGTYLPASKYARDRMWIASPLSNQNTLMMDPMPYKDFHATAGTLQQIRDADATYKMKLFDKNNPDRAEYFQRLQDFTAPWLKPETTSNEELARTYTSLGRAHKTNQQAAAVPITMDPAGYLTKYRPDLQVGDVYPEWFKYLEQKGDPIFKAEGGQIPGFAGGNQFNPANFLGAVRSYFRAMEDVKSRPITIGASDEVLPQIIKDQRFKSQFETGDSKGMYNPERRARYENEAFGYPLDLDPAQRPIYGHVTDRFRPDMAAHYGTWGAVLKPEVKDRSSFFLGDSLFQDQPSYGPYWWNRGENVDRRVMGEPASQEDRFKDYVREIIGNKQRSNASLVPVDPPVASRFPSTSGVYMPGNYIEAQVHGGLPWSDVKALVRKGRSGMPAREGDIFDINQAADLGGVPAYRWRPHSDVPGGKEWFKAEPGVSGSIQIPPEALKEFGWAEGGQIPGYAEGGAVPGYELGGVAAVTPGASAIKWIQNLLGQATTPEKEMIAAARDYTLKTGNEKYLIGSKWPRVMPEILSRTGDQFGVKLPQGYDKFMKQAGREEAEVSSAHAHPYGMTTPSVGDINVWGNNRPYSKGSMPATRWPADKYARQNMWITGLNSENDLTHMPALEHVSPDADVANVRDMWKGWRTGNTANNPGLSNAVDAFINNWHVGPDDYGQIGHGLTRAPLTRFLAEKTPLEMDPAGQLVKGRTDLPLGDVYPEWLKYLDSKGLDYMKAEGGQIPGYAEGGYDDDPSQRYSIPPGSFGLPTPPTPTFQVPIGKGQATVGSNYDMINKIIEAQLGYEHPVGSHGARLGVSGNFNKYIGEGGDQVKPNWGVGLRLNLPFAEGGQYDPYDDIAEAQRLMGAYK